MCGIFGLIAKPDPSFEITQLHTLVKTLFTLSESRGKDSAGLVLVDDAQIQVFKRPQRARHMLRSAQYKAFIEAYERRNHHTTQPVVVMGHARMVTNGQKEFHSNNQPVITDGLVCIHNGIIVNDQALWLQHPTLTRQYEVDTEVLLALIREHLRQGKSVTEALIQSMRLTRGANSVALLLDDRDGLVLATTNGSLYFAAANDQSKLLFASEEYILRQALLAQTSGVFQNAPVQQIQPCTGYVVRFDDLVPQPFSLGANQIPFAEVLPLRSARRIEDVIQTDTRFALSQTPEKSLTPRYEANDDFVTRVNAAVTELRRCTRCILPETFPFIEFDEHGVCNYCRTYKPIPFKGVDALRALVAPHRKANGRPEVLVPFSGGRDSSYGIHYIKNVLGLMPVAYTYDWGMVTDLARRNISRMCGQLGIEHILISADIKTKRENVRKNVLAWLRQPTLGTIPLFMAGDKQFFYYSNLLRKQMNIGITLYSMNPLERTDFKVGFCGINEVGRKQEKHYALALQDRLKMMSYYGWQFVTNPAYINRSLVDSFSAFLSYYMIQKDYHILYDYLRWDEPTVNATLLNEYDWETSPDTPSTWRIGDGTAAFYNYIYYTAAGFSENDTLRSNQIREGMLDRATAFELAHRDNQPRYESMRWYAETIGFDFTAAIRTINAMPKRYPFS